MNLTDERSPFDLSRRVVLGFDVREGILAMNRRGDTAGEPAIALTPEALCRFSFDLDVWPSLIERDEQQDLPYLNGYRLFPELSADVLRRVKPGGRPLQVAFDLAVDSYQELKATFGSGWERLDGTTRDLVDGSWVFMGFDVIDPRTGMSGLHSFPLCVRDRGILDVTATPSMNPVGLIGSFRGAEATASCLDALIPEHAPFCPTGLWVEASVPGNR